MDIAFRHGSVELATDVRAAAEAKLSRLARHLNGMDHTEVRFVEERNPRIAEAHTCEVTMVGHGHILRAKATGADQLSAVDRAIDKLEHRAERLKRRLKSRTTHNQRDASVDSAPDRASAHGGVDHADESHARIVKSKQFAIKPMTPEEAALQMELLGHDFFLFTNADTHKAAVVYRRSDGFIGLIDATST
jgi:putative sigma-54 modulation protein